MGNVVKITGSKSGIILKLDPEAEWELIKKEVADKFQTSADFWGDAQKAIAFQGRELDDEQQDEILEIIRKNCRLQIVCVLDEDPEKEAAFARAVQAGGSGSKISEAGKQQPICSRQIMEPVSFLREIFVPDRFWMWRQASLFWEMSTTVRRSFLREM